MGRVLFAPFTKLLERDLALYFADILSRPVIVAFTDCTLQTDEIGLRHISFALHL